MSNWAEVSTLDFENFSLPAGSASRTANPARPFLRNAGLLRGGGGGRPFHLSLPPFAITIYLSLEIRGTRACKWERLVEPGRECTEWAQRTERSYWKVALLQCEATEQSNGTEKKPVTKEYRGHPGKGWRAGSHPLAVGSTQLGQL